MNKAEGRMKNLTPGHPRRDFFLRQFSVSL
jgi:hypothetical protein